MRKIYGLFLLIIVFFSFSLNIKAISNITINNNKLVPSFDINTKVYNVFVSSKTEIITINVTPDEGEITTGGGSISLKKGLNKIEISSYKDDIITNTYILNITRGDIKYDKSISTLNNIKIKNHELEFRSNVYSYNIDALEDEDKLDITYEATNPTSNIKLEGDIILNKERNIINLIVTSEDKKNTSTYTIKVKKDLNKIDVKNKKTSIFDGKEPTKNELKVIISILILIFLIIISTLFYYIFIRKNKRYKVKIKKLKLKRKRT